MFLLDLYKLENNKEYLGKFLTKNKLDRCLKLTANCYYVNIPALREEILRYNYIDIILNTKDSI